jgi:hypothetical protein
MALLRPGRRPPGPGHKIGPPRRIGSVWTCPTDATRLVSSSGDVPPLCPKCGNRMEPTTLPVCPLHGTMVFVGGAYVCPKCGPSAEGKAGSTGSAELTEN